MDFCELGSTKINFNIMKKTLIICSFFLFNNISAQSFCEKVSAQNNIFIKAASNAVEYQSLLNSDQGIKLRNDFYFQIEDLTEKAKKYSAQKSLMNAIKLKTYAVYAYYLFKTKQFKDLQELAGKNEDLIKDINFGDSVSITCEGKGNGNIQGYDENSDSYYTTSGETTVTKYSFDMKDIDQMADQIYSYFAFASYLNNDTKKGDEFFLKTFDNRYFLNSKTEVTLILAKEILSKYKESDPITSVNFAAAITYLKVYNPSLLSSVSEKQLADLYYDAAFSILRKDDSFSSNSSKVNKKPLSSPASKSEAYSLVFNNLVSLNTSDKKDAVEMLKKYNLAEKKTGYVSLGKYKIAEMVNGKDSKVNGFTTAILNDNDQKFMVFIADKLMKLYKNNTSEAGGRFHYVSYLLYQKAGEIDKAQQAFQQIPEAKRDFYKN